MPTIKGSFHVVSLTNTDVNNLPSENKIAPSTANANGNKCCAYPNANISNFDSFITDTQRVFPLPTDAYWAIMPYASDGACTYYSFIDETDLLAKAATIPDLNGGELGGSFGNVNDVSTALDAVGGLLIRDGGSGEIDFITPA
jgi:hypothetical protein